jgi:hypothetical protein
MTPKQFQQIVDERRAKMDAVLKHKAVEYSRGGDRLHNFKTGSAFRKRKPTSLCWDFNVKHLTSINDLVDDIEAGKMPSAEMVDEKVGDAINYLVLLEALIAEAREHQK